MPSGTSNHATAPVPAFAPQEQATPYPNNISPFILDRGNGIYTRLIPADLLPPLNEVPPLEAVQGNSIVLSGRGMGYGQILTLKVRLVGSPFLLSAVHILMTFHCK